MLTWLDYLRAGLQKKMTTDRLGMAENAQDLRQWFSNLKPYVMRHKGVLVVAVISMLATTLVTLPQPLVYAYLIDNVILAGRLDRLWWVILIIGSLKLCSIGFSSFQQFLFARMEQDILLEIQSDLLERVLHFPKSFFDEKETGYLMQRLTGDVQGLRWFFSSTISIITDNLIRLIGGVFMLFYLEWRLALVSLIGAPVLAWSVRFFFDKLHTLSQHSMEQEAGVSRQVQESLASSSLIKAFATEKESSGKVRFELKSLRDLMLQQTAVNWLAGQTIQIAPGLSKAIVYLIGAIWIIQKRWQLGQLLAFQSYLGFVYGPAISLAAVSLQLQNAVTALERVSTLFDILPEENLDAGKIIDHLRGDVRFDHVSFAYNQNEQVLKDVSIDIKPGEQIAIVGPSGVGKTTLLSLILRFYKPTSGEIFFDDRPASEYELSSLRRRIGYVSQNPQLLAGTVLENLRYGNADAQFSKVVEAAKVAGIHEFITQLPEGYDAPLGERGVNLSEGQKQRISLARALIKQPDILILDEPTAALDSLVEQSIFDALPDQLQNTTVFIVAHRLATIKHANRILLLNENRLVDTGTHNELVERSHFYRSLVESQNLEKVTD